MSARPSAATINQIVLALGTKYGFDPDEAKAHLTKKHLLPANMAPKPAAQFVNPFVSPAARKLAEERGVAHLCRPGHGTGVKSKGWTVADVNDVLPAPKATDGARALAKAAGIDLGSVEGKGTHGRILQSDILALLGSGKPGKKKACKGAACKKMRKVAIAESESESSSDEDDSSDSE